MYFEPAKRTYRFPSTNSINDYQSRFYYPDQTHASGEDTRFNSSTSHYNQERENYYQD